MATGRWRRSYGATASRYCTTRYLGIPFPSPV
ncbi:hypothetical protein GQ600_1139 [Phytophthora cactorum]|nr:hypothetical protein GQ600_1139 [Phytophthora cactorum]